MKKNGYLLLAMLPIIIGYLYNLSFLVVAGIGLFYIIPIIIIILWYWVGTKFADNVNSYIVGILGGNILGILSLGIYYWQFIIRDDGKRSMFLAGLSQYFTSSLSPLTAKIGMIFEKTPNTITQTTMTAMQVIGTIIMIIVFSIGFIMRKNFNKR